MSEKSDWDMESSETMREVEACYGEDVDPLDMLALETIGIGY